ncbi:DUF2946 family protein [Polynucleobacter asymbioticus]|jgi:hypothetical protein|uniref:DUF2946 domain-containing protein n=1 Tax=Polynucleobacter asymbioticus (strain DSM 18221 / CIP 109841 / QLW-P1DMWA-1) TaxID=312153 RepID=A4SZX1_POLAQ|nr:DUF2946 family protein [Polynucleobacter asymbioticus]ABP35035.1 conserved hypothetical protein [Polynucleobacter asymbioticus QLW-P1DMWA-1]APC06811.1 hypothetical protein AOC10_09805 [Polynucleobacter asymbioticus]
MDDQVLRSLVKWPNVPECFGWLALDRRGQWRMRDEFAQQNHLSGQVIVHRALSEFISRNYACDQAGNYFFQNGPQRVFVTLDYTPWIVRITPAQEGSQFLTQCQTPFAPSAAFSDEQGNIYIAGSTHQTIDENNQKQSFVNEACQSVAILHDHDLDHFSELAILREQACSFGGSWTWHGKQLPLDPILSNELSQRFHYIKSPTPTT